MEIREFLTFCCESGFEDSTRPGLQMASKPWLITRNGEQWSVATNGRYLVAVRGSHADDSSEYTQKTMSEVLDTELPFVGDAILNCLKEWCGVPASLELETCHECLGDGVTPCPHCDQDMTCDECGGDGEVRECREIDPAFVGDVLIDREKLSHILRCFSDERVKVFGDADLLKVSGGDWVVMLIGVAKSENDSMYPKFTFQETVTV